MNIFFWASLFFFSILNAQQAPQAIQVNSIQIDNKIPMEASDALKIDWFRMEEGKPLNFEKETSNVFKSYILKPGNQTAQVPHEANSFKCSGTVKQKIDKKPKSIVCNLSSNIEKISPNKTSFSLKISEKCNLNANSNNECNCDIIIE